MRTRICILPFIALSSLFLEGCSAIEEVPQINTDDTQQVPILLTTGAELQTEGTRATDFPNNKQIAVTAAVYNSDPDQINWTSYEDIQDEPATAGIANSAGIYPFSWQKQKYWPMEDEELVFLAYSPRASTHDAMRLTEDHTKLEITLQQNMPDILYADNNGQPGNYKKTGNNSVDLGEFQHALTQLSLKVEAMDGMNDQIRLTDLYVITPDKKGTLNLQTGSIELQQNESFTFEVVKGKEINFSEKNYEAEVLVLPHTHEGTRVYVKFLDGGLSADFTFAMDQFEKNGVDIIYEPGHNIELTIYVKGTLVTGDPDLVITLGGIISDWKDKGDYEIEIK